VFDALVIDAEDHAATITIDDPAVRARCSGENLQVGTRIRATLQEADIVKRLVRFTSSG